MRQHQSFHLSSSDSAIHWWPLYTTRSQRQSLLRVIVAATEAHVPLAPLVEAWAADERGVQRGRVRRLAALLASGTPLPQAVEQTPGVLRDQDILAIRFGAQSGALASTLRDSLNEADAARQTTTTPPGKSKGYFVTFALIALLIGTFFQVKIVPSLRSIYEDFDLDLPPVAQLSINLTSALQIYWPILLLAFIFAVLLFLSNSGRQLLRRSFAGRWFTGTREMLSADILQKLSVAAQAGRPTAGALSTLARYHFDPEMRHKLLYIRNEVEQGADVWQSMTAAHLLAPRESAVLTTADRVGNRSWALRQVAAGKTRRTLRSRRRRARWLHPLLILLAGGYVLLNALAMFSVLTHLVSSLGG